MRMRGGSCCAQRIDEGIGVRFNDTWCTPGYQWSVATEVVDVFSDVVNVVLNVVLRIR